MIGQDRKEIETVGNHQQTRVMSDAAQRHQDRDFPQTDHADITRSRVIERSPLAGGEPLRRNPRPENEMGVDQQCGDHVRGSKSQMTSSGMVKSSESHTPASSPYLIGCRLGSGPRPATARPLRVRTKLSPASARATSAAKCDLAYATDTVVLNLFSGRF